MAAVVLFHHAQGQTAGFFAFADKLRAAGHTIHAPDLYDGRTFPTLDEGVAHAKQVGFDTLGERGGRAVEGLPNEVVYAGFSLGVMPAQMLAQTRPGAKGALLFHAAFPTSEFGAAWPRGVPLQIHMMDADEWVLEGDLDAARELEKTVEGAELFLYPGDRHLFADSSLPDYDDSAAALLTQRVLAFLKDVGSQGLKRPVLAGDR
ncbi:MAG: dienelactone hydrolase [Chloroflexi bacterium]|nr:MAG: dienelactone hydrolase [Chloroflexota bacterium]